ncbi:LysR family transcriptional regulator substrate-binding protein [Streptomyces prunicolor]|uniref:LysR family transcriptional regulator substrate-binding protein n=1 Tax=Streptomyces prunicolor TaxID=67348 RepID=UPI00225AE6D2|nr:LysR family transcriptional regulator substrate-binding protein [Streptomyces prunicolor]MCX5240236.1 LysR family transcriptional regulator substrate-binding protein [Streptomyces prunicolor]
MTGSEASPTFRLAYVPGVTPAKWVRIWNERRPDVPLVLVPVPAAEAADVLRRGEADAGLVRLPVDREVFSAIALYTEATVVVAPKDHVVTAAEEVSLDELADEVVLHPLDDVLDWQQPPGEPAFERPATTEDAVEHVASGIGILYVPQSLARLHHRRDLTYRTVVDAPQSDVVLSWPEDRTTELVEDFIGIVRGRTVNSTRGRTQTPAEPKTKAKAKRTETPARRKPAAGKTSGKTGRTGNTGKNPRGASGGAKGTKRGKPRGR